MAPDPDDGFTATFAISVPRTEAWDRLVGATPAHPEAPTPGADQCWLPGFADVGDVLERDEGARLRVRKVHLPCDGTEIVLHLADDGTGTRVTVTQHGFGPLLRGDGRPWFAAGWAAIVADLAAALEHGVDPRRHQVAWASLGCAVAESPAGPVVGPAEPGAYAARAGLAAGDVLVGLGGAPVTSVADLAVLLRGALAPGAHAEVRFVRDGALHTASAPL